MQDELKKDLSNIRLEKAEENLTAAESLISSGSYKIAATRAYYAVFHAMRAVLAFDEIDRKHHSAVIAEFRQRYIKSGLIDKKQSDTISKLFALRTDSDYDDFFVISKNEVQEAVKKAEEFVTEIRSFLQSRW